MGLTVLCADHRSWQAVTDDIVSENHCTRLGCIVYHLELINVGGIADAAGQPLKGNRLARDLVVYALRSICRNIQIRPEGARGQNRESFGRQSCGQILRRAGVKRQKLPENGQNKFEWTHLSSHLRLGPERYNSPRLWLGISQQMIHRRAE